MSMKLLESPTMAITLKRLLRSQMVAKGVEYRDLALRLKELGVEQKEGTLRTKVNTGTMGAQLFLYIQLALGVKQLTAAQIEEILNDVATEQQQQQQQKTA